MKQSVVYCSLCILATLSFSASLTAGSGHHSGNYFGHGSDRLSGRLSGHASGSDHSAKFTKSSSEPFTQAYLPRVIKAADTTLGAPALFGQWSDVMSWPVIAVHANLLPTGKVLAWDATPDDLDDDPHTTDNYTTRVSLWDPQTNLHLPTNNDTNTDLFCAGSAQLWDGRVLFAGGDSGVDLANGPLANTNIYDPDTNTWRQVANMATPRWYASVATLANGEMLTFAGTYSPDPVAEVFQLDETWRSLGGASSPGGLSINYQWLQSTPEGKVMSFGPQNTLLSIDTAGGGRLTQGQQRDQYPLRRYGSYAMFDIGKVLVSGGTVKDGGVPAYKSSVVIDTATQQTTDTGDMNIGRTQHNLTILADGSVLATGGNSDGAPLVSESAAIFEPEIWSPDTGQWTRANGMQVDRQYHSIALLLPDGRVLSAGGGYCGRCLQIGYEEQNAEIFSPPYLFSEGGTPAQRPVITAAPGAMDYAASYNVATSNNNQITKVHLIKLGAVTHGQNQDQRLVPLSYNVSGGSLAVSSPANRNIAPPGHYMLVVVNGSGVPSVSKIVRVGQPLLTSGAVVTNAVRGGQIDEYVIESGGSDKTMLLDLSGQTSAVNLTVTGKSDSGDRTAQCNVNSAQTMQCKLANTEPTRWYVYVRANSETRYNLTGRLSSEEDPEAIQPGQGGNVRVGGSGASNSIGFLLVLYAVVCRRRLGLRKLADR